MICPESWKYFMLSINVGQLTFAIPFYWSYKERKLKFSECGEKRLSRLMWIFLMYTIYLGFTIHLDLKTFGLRDPFIAGDLTMRLVYMLCTIAFLILFQNMLWNPELYTVYINEWIYLYRHINQKYVLLKCRPWTLNCVSILKLLSLTYLVVPCGQIIHFLEFPQSKVYVHWIYEDLHIELINWVMVFFQLIGIILFTLSISSAAMFHCFMYLIPVSICANALKETCPLANPFVRFKTRHLLRDCRVSVAIYRAFYINTRQGNHVTYNFIYYIQIIGSYCAVICIVCLCHFRLAIGLKTAFMLLICGSFSAGLLTLMLQVCALFTIKTGKWVTHWKIATWPRSLKRQCKRVGLSLQPIEVDMSGFYKICMMRVLIFVHFLLWSTSKGLLFISDK